MTLGERIRTLRTAAGLSQETLAEKLDVSRQSLSKWETDASVPELDKLLLLREVFGVTLDELVCGAPACDTEPDIPSHSANNAPVLRHTVGYILLGVGLLCCVLAFIFSRALLLFGAYLVLCSVICFTVRRHQFLVIGWISIALFLLLHMWFTGINVFSVFYNVYTGNATAAKLVIPLLFWGILFLLLLLTLRVGLRLRNKDSQKAEKRQV